MSCAMVALRTLQVEEQKETILQVDDATPRARSPNTEPFWSKQGYENTETPWMPDLEGS